MINSFWNICSTCPMPKEEKVFLWIPFSLNSEYKRNYVWHPIYRSVPQDVVSIPPQALAKELGIQRKKQYPELAYRTHEVIRMDNSLQSKDTVDLRTRSEERGLAATSKSGPGSRSAESSVGRQHQKTVMIQSYPPLAHDSSALMSKMEEGPEGVQKNTEYRSQFAWPRHSADKICIARKSLSMGLINAPDQPDAPIHPTKTDDLGVYQKLPTQEEEVGNLRETNVQDLKKKAKTEYKAKYKPFTSYVYVDGQWKKTSRLLKIPENHGTHADSHPWYSEVMERLQRANEYKCRGHGYPLYGEHLSSVYTKRHDTTPVGRPKKDFPDVHTTVTPETKSADVKKREKRERPDKKAQSVDKRQEREKRAESRRPKSADPVKGRRPRPQQRPQTAPPPGKERPLNPVPAHHAYARKSATKAAPAESRGKSTSRAPSSQKQKDPSSRPHDGRASRTSHHPPASSAGKVWLQAGAPVPPESESFKGKHSDAVRPSTLLPPKSPTPPDTTDAPISSEEAKIAEPIIFKIPSAPVPLTHVQTPEEVTGVKSPEPENWTVPLDKGQKLQWTESSVNEPLLPQTKPATPKTEPETETIEKEPVGKESKEPETVVPEAGSESQPEKPPSPKLTTTDVLDRARSRLDQFWGKK